MNKRIQANEPIPKRWSINAKIKDILLLGGLGLVLIFAAWKVFYTDEKAVNSSTSSQSENERKVSRLLSEIDGVGEASVMICETEDGVTGAVVVCDGAKDLRVVIDIREAVAAALGTEEKAVKVYLKK